MAELQAEPVAIRKLRQALLRGSPPPRPRTTPRECPGSRSAAAPFRCTPPSRESRAQSRSRSTVRRPALAAACAGKLAREPEAHDLMRGERPGPQATLLAAAEDSPGCRRARLPERTYERADALRAVELVGGKAQEINGKVRTSIASLPTDCAASAVQRNAARRRTARRTLRCRPPRRSRCSRA